MLEVENKPEQFLKPQHQKAQQIGFSSDGVSCYVLEYSFHPSNLDEPAVATYNLPILACDFSVDGRLATGGGDMCARLW